MDYPKPISTPEIEAAMQDLRSAVERYDGVSDKLRARLHPVVRGGIPSTVPIQTIPCEETRYSAPLAEEIHVIYLSVRDITNELEDLLERIEL